MAVLPGRFPLSPSGYISIRISSDRTQFSRRAQGALGTLRLNRRESAAQMVAHLMVALTHLAARVAATHFPPVPRKRKRKALGRAVASTIVYSDLLRDITGPGINLPVSPTPRTSQGLVSRLLFPTWRCHADFEISELEPHRLAQHVEITHDTVWSINAAAVDCGNEAFVQTCAKWSLYGLVHSGLLAYNPELIECTKAHIALQVETWPSFDTLQ